MISHGQLEGLQQFILTKLQQRQYLQPDDVMRWLEGLVASGRGKVSIDDIKWHIRRASGFGGSEIGTMILWDRGHFTPFTSARTIVAEKLFRAIPDADTDDTRRGRVLEPIARQTFIDTHPELQRDPNLLNLMKGHRYRGAESVIGTPDDIFRDQDGDLIIVDYKAPRPTPTLVTGDTSRKQDEGELVSEAEAEWFRYACQLHQYRAILLDVMDKAGLPLVNVSMELIRFNAWNGLVSMDNIPYDEQLERDMFAVHQTLWAHVMRGELPASEARPDVLELSLSDEMQKVVEERALFAQIASFATKQSEQRKEIIIKAIQQCGVIGDQAIVAGPLLISAETVIDEDLLVNEAARFGIGVEAFCSVSKAVNGVDADRVLTTWAQRASAILQLPLAEQKEPMAYLFNEIGQASPPLLDDRIDAQAAGKKIEDLAYKAGRVSGPKKTVAFLQSIAETATPRLSGELNIEALSQDVLARGGRVEQFKREKLSIRLPRGQGELGQQVKMMAGVVAVNVQAMVDAIRQSDDALLVRPDETAAPDRAYCATAADQGIPATILEVA